jgi:hypothetical protein
MEPATQPLLDLFGVTIYDADVALTDVGLALMGAWLAWRLWAVRGRGPVQAAGATLLAGLGSGALWGAVFHGLLPAETTSLAAVSVWTLVGLSMLVVGATLVDLGLRTAWPNLAPSRRRGIVGAYAVLAAAVFIVDPSSSTMVRFHAPAGVFFLLAAVWRTVRSREIAWGLVVLGVGISAAAALLQQMRVAIDPVYFDHNALYHVVQAGAVLLLYHGLRDARLRSRHGPSQDRHFKL